jgi:hypothetical protein
MEDEMHMLFLCPFSKAAWFCNPWFIKTELLAAAHNSIPDMINALLSSDHPQMNTTNLYTFLWCLWKARNDTLFGRKIRNPTQVFAAFNAVLQGSNLEGIAARRPGSAVRGSAAPSPFQHGDTGPLFRCRLLNFL